MAATLKLTQLILGILNVAANRFEWTVVNETGELKLRRMTGQEIINVDSAGRVAFPQGMPLSGTAPIVDSGSNTNGNWTKFADGTMICTVHMNAIRTASIWGALIYAVPIPWTFPQPFASIPPVVTGTGFDSDANGWVGGGNDIRLTSVTMQQFTINSASKTFVTLLTAVGRWK